MANFGSTAIGVFIDDILGESGTPSVADIDGFSGTPDYTGSTNNLVTRDGGSGLPDDAYIFGNPKLGPLASNGGPTQTMALLAGSPAIGIGTAAYYDYPGTSDPITTDQRGYPLSSPPDLGSYAYTAAPVVSAVSPTYGPIAGGTSVTITGTGFADVTEVDFGTVAATNVVVVNATTITATSPSSPSGTGTVDVTVTAPSGQSATTDADEFTYGIPTFTWVGGGSTNNWNDGTNWIGGRAPVAGANLMFEAMPAGYLSVNDFAANTSFGSITIADSGYAILGNPIDLTGEIDATYSANTSTFDVASALTADQTISVAAGATLDFGGVISGSGYNLTKTGDGTLELDGTNTYTGTTTIGAGIVSITDSSALGTGAVTDDSELDLSNNIDISNTLTLDSAGLAINSVSDSNTVSGSITLGSYATIDVADTTTLTVSGPIGDGGNSYGITTTGTGVLDVTGDSTYTGDTIVDEGTLLIDGDISDSSGVLVDSGATLGGSGTAPAVTVAHGGIVAPGSPPGILFMGDVDLESGSNYDVQINDAIPGDYSQLDASGTVDLDGANLSLTVSGSFTASAGDTFTIVNNTGDDPVTGTFLGLNEGSTLTSGGQSFVISYVGGTGNDVVLTPFIPYQPVISGLTDQILTYGTNSATFSGSITAGANIPSGDEVAIGLDGVVEDATIGGDGSFSATFSISTLGVANSPYSVSYDFAAQGNYLAANGSSKLTISPKPLTASIAADDKVYDGTISATVTPTLNGVINGDYVTLVDGMSTFASRNVGTWTVTDIGITIVGPDADNYTVNSTANSTANITAAPLTISAVSDSKSYDGTVSSSATPTVGTLYGDDTVTGLAQAFESPNVMGADGSTLYVTAYTINDGNGGNNYDVTTETAAGTITPASLIISAVYDSKTYDGTTDSSATPVVDGTLYGDDSVSGLAQAFESPNVMGCGDSTLYVTAYTVNDGNGGDNYDVTTETASGMISPASLTISAVYDSKTYDGTTDSSATPLVDGTLYGDDSVSGLAQAFESPNVMGCGDSTLYVTTYTVNDGNGGDNYDVTTETASGMISPASLTISAVYDSKTYDGTTDSSATPLVDGTLYGDDSVSGLAQAFESANVMGCGDSTLYVTAYTVNDGNDGDNYDVTTETASGMISPASLAISAVYDSKTYDGTTDSSATPVVDGTLYGDDSVSGLAQAFESANVMGCGDSTLYVTAYTVNDGSDGDNYDVTTETASGMISPASLTISAVYDSKTYDGTTDSSATPVVDGTLYGDDTVSGLAQAFESPNVMGCGDSTLYVTAYTVNDGNDGDNYEVTTETASGMISPASLTISAVYDSKTYDGTTDSSATPVVDGTLYGDDTVSGLAQAFESPNVMGCGDSTLYVTAYTVNDGNDGDNYEVTTETASGMISPASLTISAVYDSKTYDGTTDSSATPVVDGTLYGDDTVSGLAQAFESPNVMGCGDSTLYVTAYTVNDGNGGDNYDVTTETASGMISPASLTISAVYDSKTYDGTTDSSATPVVDGTLYGDDSVSGLAQAFESPNVMGCGDSTLYVTAYTVNDGSDGDNYEVTTETASGMISPASLTISAVYDSKTYDGTTDSSATPLVDGTLYGDDSVSGLAQAFESPNVMGCGDSTLYVTTYTVNDGNGGDNYDVTTETASGMISPASLTISAVYDSKTYDGTTDSSATPLVDGTLYGDDTVSGLAQAFESPSVMGCGDSTLYVTTYTVNDGNDGDNYDVTTETASGMISPASLTISAVYDSKTYDGTTDSSATPVVDGTLYGDDSVSGLAQAFESPNVMGCGDSTLYVTTYTVNDGNGGDNYDVTTETASGMISPASLTISAVYDSKTYDGTTDSSATPLVDGTLYGDDSVSGLAQAFESPNVMGCGDSTLYVTAYTVNDGNGGDNYDVTTETASGMISPASLTISAVYDSKTYDGTTDSSATPLVDGTLYGDDTVSGLAQAFESPNVMGCGDSTLYVTTYTVNDGNGGDNYDVTTETASGMISPASLTISAVYDSKTYDGTTDSSATPVVDGTLYGDDSVSGLAQAFESPNVMGCGDSTLYVTTYTVNDGNGGDNYDVTTETASGMISPASLTISAVYDSKTYDGTTDSSATPLVDGTLYGDDTVSGLAQAFESPNVMGCGDSTLYVTAYTVNDGNDGDNYEVTTETASGMISPASLTISAVYDSKTYDGTTDSSATPVVDGTLYGDDSVSGLAQAFESPNVMGCGDSTLYVTAYTVNDGNGGDNYDVTTETASGMISPASLTISAVYDSKTYDGTTDSSATPTVDGTLYGDDSVSGLAQAFESPNVMGCGDSTLYITTYTVNDGNGGDNYDVTTETASGMISPASLTISAVYDSKTYDGTTDSLATPVVDGTLYGDDSVSGLAQAFESANVMGCGDSTLYVTAYTVNDDNGGDNYEVTTETASGMISPASLTISAVYDSKTYDGTTDSSATPVVDGTLYGDDSVSGLAQAFESPNVMGCGDSTLYITTYTVNDGNGGDNYDVTTETASGMISPASLTISAVYDSKTYDGTTDSSATPLVDGTLYGDDTVSGLAQAFESPNVMGCGDSTLYVTTYTVNDGNGGDNYDVTTETASGMISPASLTISAVYDSKTYDGTTDSSATPTVGTLFGDDSVTGLAQAFESPNVLGTGGSTLDVTAYTVNDGNGGANYSVTTNTAPGTITPASLLISAVTAGKTYDGTTSSTATPTVGTLYGGDTVTGLAQAYESKNVLGTGGSTLDVTAYTVNDGNGGANYSVTTNTAPGTITPASLLISAVTAGKTYDGTTSSTATPTVGTLYGGDTVTGLAQAYESKNVLGTGGSTLDVTAYTVNDGNGGANYSVTTNTAPGTITPASLLISAVTAGKTYDGTTSSTATPTVGTLYGGDTVTGLAQAYESKNVLGTGGSTLDVTAYTVNDGNGGANYSVTTNTAPGTITPASLLISAVTAGKTYDGTTSSTATPTVGTLYGGDTVTGLAQAYESKNVLGTGGSTLDVTAYTVNDGNGGANYSVTTNTAPGTITPASLLISAVTAGKTYDGTTSSTATPTVGTLYGGDTVTGLAQAYESQNVLGTGGSTLEVTSYTVNDGNDGANYAVMTETAPGTITPAPLTVTADDASKIYGQTVTFTGTEFTDSGLIDGDSVSSVTLTSAGAAASATVAGSPYAIVPSAATGSGLANYTINYVDGSLTVAAATESGNVTSSAPQTFYGENVVFTATFSSSAAGAAPMTGTVTFYSGQTYLGSAPIVPASSGAIRASVVAFAENSATVSGQATLPTSLLPVGNSVITAVYSGDSNYSGATSNTPVMVQVAPATTSTSLSTATTPQGTILTATVTVTSPGNPPIAGSVAFYQGTTLLGTAPVINGVATLNIGAVSIGSGAFSAVFSGSGGTMTTSAVRLPAADGPQVTRVLRYGFHAQSTFLVVGFNGSLNASSAQDVSNYRIVGPRGRKIKINKAVYDPATGTVTLKPAERLNIHRTYKLTIDGSSSSGMASPAGVALDGAGTGKPGSNYVTSLTWRNLAGSARQLPTSGLVHGDAAERARTHSEIHRAHATLQTRAVDHLLATDMLHVIKSRRTLR